MSRTPLSRALVVLASLILLGATAGVAAAHHKDKKDQGSPPAHAGKPDDGGKPAPDDRSLHPSGKNREQNPGPADDEQGKSPSDPDGMENGGADKPGGDGGVYDWDQDGNNGCGNDTDFEDDNNGNCGGPEKVQAARVCPRMLPEQAGRAQGKRVGHERRAARCEAARPAEESGAGRVAANPRVGGGGDDAAVLGVSMSRDESESAALPAVQARGPSIAAAPLAVTGGPVLSWIVLAALLAGAGALLLGARRWVPRDRRHG